MDVGKEREHDCMDAGGRAPKVGALGDAGAVAEDPADSGGVCRKRQFSLPLKQAYSGLQNFCGAHGTPQKLWRAQKHQSVSMVMVGELNWPSR
ncbi:hypothetical protein [Methylobacter tundripaludum]|uniref:hypothetical protein n=1 Tax=Methylobacter tundripaludum TaxID=173365 RepID=UPI001237630A|nr:hypothetical protein [Methylobacter tundripaludum]